jgi:hypothetical protein
VKYQQTALLAVAIGAALTAVSFQPPAAASSSQPVMPAAIHGGLGDVEVFSPHLAWAVGGTNRHSTGGTLLAERWDGDKWTRVDVPEERGRSAGFVNVAGSSPHDVWAIGAKNRGHYLLSFADHWDGSTWTRVPIPNVRRLPFISLLQGLSVVSPTDAWASGYAGSSRPWVLHWDGVTWTRVPCPNFAGPWGTTVWGIAACSAADAWIVGTVGTRSGAGRTFAAHWDGTRWTRAATPNVPHLLNVPWSVGASSPDNIWAAGYAINQHTGAGGPMAMHWDGTAWRLATLPRAGKNAQFYNIDTSSSTDAWAVGDDENGALAMHWDGRDWTIKSPHEPAGSLGGIGDLSSQLAITVGGFSDGTVLHEVWDGTGWH